jgi:hypothetical protein
MDASKVVRIVQNILSVDPSHCGTKHETDTRNYLFALAIGFAIVRQTCNIKRVPGLHAINVCKGRGGNSCLCTG